MNTILRENEKNVISAGSAGSASRDNNIEQTTNTDTEYNWHDDNMASNWNYNSTPRIMKTKTALL